LATLVAADLVCAVVVDAAGADGTDLVKGLTMVLLAAAPDAVVVRLVDAPSNAMRRSR